jgi:hypothetical protein
MNAEQIIGYLRRASAGSRALDAAIGQLMGWRYAAPPGSTGAAILDETTVWFPPNSAQPGRLPHYTTDLQDALNLAIKVSPDSSGGIGWEPDKGSGTISKEVPCVEAPSPQLAKQCQLRI